MAILILGATATVGQAAALQLLQGQNQVRGLVRGGSSNPNAKKLQAAGATIVEGDLTQPSTLKAASAGTATIVCTATSMPKAAR